MKKILLIAFIGFTLQLYGQKNPLNLSFGGNLSTFAGKDLNNLGLDSKFKPGYFVGISIDDELTDRITIETGVDYASKNYEIDPEIKYTSHFSRVFVFGRFYFDKIYILVGPELNVNLHTKVNVNSEGVNISDNSEIATFGPSGGIGIKISDNISAYSKYHHNFIGFFNDELKIFSRTVDIGLKYRIRQ